MPYEEQETKQFWTIVSELRQERADKLSDAELLGLLDELQAMSLHTSQPFLAARCRAEIARFSEDAAAVHA